MAGHVAADLDFNSGRFFQAIERVITGYLVNPVQRHACPLGEGAKLVFLEIAVPILDVMQLLNDHYRLPSFRVPSRKSSMLPGCGAPRSLAEVPCMNLARFPLP